MRRVVGDRVGLADALLVDEIRRHEVVLTYRAGIAQRERRILQRPLDRTPQIDHLHPPLQQLVGLVGDQVADPLRAGSAGVVDMDPGRGLAWTVARIIA